MITFRFFMNSIIKKICDVVFMTYVKEATQIAYMIQKSLAVLFGAPTNFPEMIPRPLKIPTADTSRSLTATFIINRF